jgi:ADP-ribose pyrophosphatase YjhB (NUDIX family)
MKIHHKIAGIILKNSQLLMCRKYNEPHFIMPGGEIKKSETPEQALRRELKEELNVNLVSIKYFSIYAARHFKKKNVLVLMEVYLAKIKGKPKATSEINEISWIDSSYKKKGIKLASINRDYLIPELKKRRLIR